MGEDAVTVLGQANCGFGHVSDSSESDSADAAKLAAVLIDLSSLKARAGKSVDAVQALEKISFLERRDMQRQYLRLLQTRFRWWQAVSSPIHVWLFNHERRRVSIGSIARLDRDSWHRLNRLSDRIEFGFYVDPASATHLRRSVRDEVLTARDAWRLLHSLGCRVKEDRLEPAHLTRSAAMLGLAVGGVLGLIALLFAVDVVIGLVSGCEYKICQILGSGMLCAWLLFIAPLLICCTWGRRDAANALHALLFQEPDLPAVPRPALKRPLIARLAW